MSVLKNKRGLSKLEFYHTARKLREDITNLLLRDFGVRDKVRKIKDVYSAYQSWRGNYLKRFDAFYTVRRMDSLYNRLFINSHFGG